MRHRHCPPLVAGTPLSGFPQSLRDGPWQRWKHTWDMMCCGSGVGPSSPSFLLHPWERFDHCRAQGGAGKGLFAPPRAPQ